MISKNLDCTVLTVLLLFMCVVGCTYLPAQEGTSSGGQAKTLQNVLVGPRWEIRSGTLGGTGTSLEAVFKNNNSFEGVLRSPRNSIERPQQIEGSFHISDNLLILKYGIAFTVGNTSHPTEVEVLINITELSEDKIKGLDKFLRLWEFERMK